MRKLTKLVCVGNISIFDNFNKFIIGEIYNGYYEDSHPKHFWAIKSDSETIWQTYSLQPLDNFTPLSEYREEQINKILDL